MNFDWLSPFSVGGIVEGKAILERLREASGDHVNCYNYHDYVIHASALQKGIKYYDIALRIYMGAVLKRILRCDPKLKPPTSQVGLGRWNDLSGLLLPESEENRLIKDIKDGTIGSIDEVTDRFIEIDAHYREYRWTWTYRLILDYYGLTELGMADVKRIQSDYITARRAWIAEIRKDAEKEYQMGDVEPSVLEDFITALDHEVDYEQ